MFVAESLVFYRRIVLCIADSCTGTAIEVELNLTTRLENFA